MKTLAPIGLTTYVRLSHLQMTVEALQNNELAKKSRLYVFSDGPREGDEEAVKKVRSYLHRIEGFQEVHIIERTSNGRVANNRGGMQWLLERYDKLIWLADDNVTSPGFLRYMNDALDFYENDEKVLNITGYCPPIKIPNKYNKDFFVLPRACAWGFGLYQRTLDVINRPIDRVEFERVVKQKKMHVAGNDVMWMVQQEVAGSLQAGDVRCMYHQLLHSQYTVYPRYSLVQNIGHDGSGVHCGKNTRFHHKQLWEKTEGFVFENKPKVNKAIVKANFKFRSGGFRAKIIDFTQAIGIYHTLKFLKEKMI